MEPGSRIVLVVPRPTWVEEGNQQTQPPQRNAMRALEFLEDTVVARAGHSIRVFLTGDLHHYARYVEGAPAGESPGDGGAPIASRNEANEMGRHASPVPGRSWITCGGGGAHFRGTHDLPDRIDLPFARPGSQPRLRYGPLELKKTFPSKSVSRRIGWRVAGLVGICPPAAALFGTLAALLAWSLGGELHSGLATIPWRLVEVGAVVRAFGGALLSHPLPAIAVAGFVVALLVVADARAAIARLVMGGLHAAAHALAFVAVAWGAARLGVEHAGVVRGALAVVGAVALLVALRHAVASGRQNRVMARPSSTVAVVLLGVSLVAIGVCPEAGPGVRFFRFLGALFVAGALVHTTIVGVYLALCSWRGRHVVPATVSQAIPDFRSFLRIRVTRDELTIYPVAIERVDRRWRWDPAGAHGAGRFEPADGLAALLGRARLLEPPIRVPR